MAKTLLDVTEWKIKLYPHTYEYDGKKYSVSALAMWRYNGELTPAKNAAISLAPRIPEIIAAMLLQVYWFIPYGWWSWILIAFGIGGLIDLAIGSTSSIEMSDLCRASRALNISPWILRIAGWTVVLAAGPPVIISMILQLL